MANKLRFPQMQNLCVGQSLLVPMEAVGNLVNLRNAVSAYGKRRGMVFSVHLNRGDGVVEIARISDAEALVYPIVKSTPRGYSTTQELKDKVNALAARRMAEEGY